MARTSRWPLVALVIGLLVFTAPVVWRYELARMREAGSFLEVLPSSEYREWWQEMETCSGRYADLHTFRFVVVRGPSFTLGTLALVGFYDLADRTMFVAQDAMFERAVVGHEMLHALGIFGHPDEPFGRCGVI